MLGVRGPGGVGWLAMNSTPVSQRNFDDMSSRISAEKQKVPVLKPQRTGAIGHGTYFHRDPNVS